MYVSLLKNKSYHNLDELGEWTNEEDIVDEGRHSMNWIVNKYLEENHIRNIRGKMDKG